MKLLKKIFSARENHAGNVPGIQDVIGNLRLLSKGEGAIAEFYQLCGDVLTDDRAFWHEVAKCERTHAETALKMADLVEREPGKYRPGNSCNVALIRLLSAHIHDLVARMREGMIRKEELLSMAADIESSVVELSYKDLVKTNVTEYCAMARRLEEDTAGHRRAFEERMKGNCRVPGP